MSPFDAAFGEPCEKCPENPANYPSPTDTRAAALALCEAVLRMMALLRKHGGAIVPHLLDNDENAGEEVRRLCLDVRDVLAAEPLDRELLVDCLALVRQLKELRAPRDIEEGSLMWNTCDYYALDDLESRLTRGAAEPSEDHTRECAISYWRRAPEGRDLKSPDCTCHPAPSAPAPDALAGDVEACGDVLRADGHEWSTERCYGAARALREPDEEAVALRECAGGLAMMALQSTRYQTDADYRDETDAVLAMTVQRDHAAARALREPDEDAVARELANTRIAKRPGLHPTDAFTIAIGDVREVFAAREGARRGK